MSTPKHDKCLKCGERFECLDLLLMHFYFPNGRKKTRRVTMPPFDAKNNPTKCLTEDEMKTLGWRKWYGVWRESLSGATAD